MNILSAFVIAISLHAQGLRLINPFWSATPGNGLLNGLQAYWKLDEASGNALDASGNGHDLTEVGTISSVSGALNTARAVGLGEVFKAADAAWNKINSGPLTFACWARMAAPESGFTALLSKGESGADGMGIGRLAYYLSIANSGTIPVDRFGVTLWDPIATTGDSQSQDLTMVATTWYFICARYDQAGNKVYLSYGVGGGSLTQDSTGVTLVNTPGDPPTTQYFGLGAGVADDGTTVIFKADAVDMDETGFWNVKLTDAQVVLLFNSGAPLPFYSFTN